MAQISLSRSIFTTTAILAGSSAALLMGGIARADTAPAPTPGVPGLSAVEQLANVPAIAPQLLQDAAASLTGPAATAPTVPATQPTVPGASANITLPQTLVPQAVAPQTVPGQIGTLQPVTVANPGLTDQLVPNTQVKLPTVPGLPVPLPQQVSVPGDLAGLLPVALTGPAQAVTPAVSPAAVAPAVAAGPAAVAPVTGGLVPDLTPLIPLSALP